MAHLQLVEFDGVSRPVGIANAPRLVECLSSVFDTWPHRLVTKSDSNKLPVISVRYENERYYLTSPWRKGNPETHHEVDAACAIVVDLIAAHIDEYPDQLCFHAAAVEFHGRLIVFPSEYRAGKSLLCGGLAASGFRVFADDLLTAKLNALGNCIEGMATGVSPRLRIPIPDSISDRISEFIENRRGAASERYLYLDLNPSELAPHRTSLPIAGFILLDRQPGAKATLQPVSTNDMLRRVVWQNFGRGQGAETILNQLHTLVERSLRFRLQYEDIEDAIAILEQEISPDQVLDPFLTSVEGHQSVANPDVAYCNPDPSSTWLQWSPGITERIVDGDSFLADRSGDAIHHLNATGSMIWRLHSEPIERNEVIEVMRLAFSDADPEQLEKDVQKVVSSLLQKRLLRGVEPGTIDNTSMTEDQRD